MKGIDHKNWDAKTSKLLLCGILLILLFFNIGCSSVNISSAQKLSVAGKATAMEAKKSVLVSEDEYLRARDAESFFHGFNNSIDLDSYSEILKKLESVQIKMSKRATVFQQLSQVYDQFGNLTSIKAAEQTEKALNDLGGAMNNYANAVGKENIVNEDDIGALSSIGGKIADEIKKKMIKEASVRIRQRLYSFYHVLNNPLVREQHIGFKTLLSTDRNTVLALMMDSAVFELNPLLDDLGKDAGLKSTKNATTLLYKDPKLKAGIIEIVNQRLNYRKSLIEQSYDSTLVALNKLITAHKKLEEGKELDLVGLAQIISEMRTTVEMLSTH